MWLYQVGLDVIELKWSNSITMYVKEPLHVYNNNIIMSSIIDQDVFSFFTSEDDNSYDNQALSFAQSLSRKISQE